MPFDYFKSGEPFSGTGLACYSMLHGSEQHLASKYKLLLPSEEELRSEIEAQKPFWIEQHAAEKRGAG